MMDLSFPEMGKTGEGVSSEKKIEVWFSRIQFEVSIRYTS